MLNPTLRILFVVPIPWSPNLGVTKVRISLKDEFQKLGHHVEKFDVFDAFPELKKLSARQSRLLSLFRPSFEYQAKKFIQRNARRFDVIDFSHDCLPFSKEELNFHGLLVARSDGLSGIFSKVLKDFKKDEKFHNALIKWVLLQKKRYGTNNWIHGLKHSDLIILPNKGEIDYLHEFNDLCQKTVLVNHGLSEIEYKILSSNIHQIEHRLLKPIIVFLGSWSPNKGSQDWKLIIPIIREKIPGIIFRFIGTGCGKEKVVNDLELEDSKNIEVFPGFDNSNLSTLLQDATVVAFPSYCEGFGLAVLEKIASGIPTVAYDVFGTRETLRCIESSLLVPCGDVKQFSTRIVSILNLEKAAYKELSMKCVRAAKKFSWKAAASKTIAAYLNSLKDIDSPKN